MLRIELIKKDFYVPTKSYIGDAGWDVMSMEDKVLQPGEHYQFKLGFRILGQPGKVYITHGRSSLAIKHGIDVIGDVIDNGYRGEVSVILQNRYGVGETEIKKGDRIAQILIQDVDDDSRLMIDGRDYTRELGFRKDNAYGSSGK